MTASDTTPEKGKNLTNSSERRLTLETDDGDLAAIVTVTGMGHETSPEIVEDVEAAIRSEMDQNVRGDE